MAGKTVAGIDLGASQIKVAVCEGGSAKKTAAVDVPENLIKNGRIVSYEAMTDLIKTLRQEAGISERRSVIGLSLRQSFLRRVRLPKMTEEQLKLNLPYEFRDFLSDDKSKYYYDYALISYLEKEDGEEDGEETMDLLAATADKETINDLRRMMSRAGFRPFKAVPQELGYGNILREYEKNHPAEERRDYCIIDLGHEGTRVHLFRGPHFEVTRAIELGGRHIDLQIAESMGVDEFLAKTYKHSNYQDCLSLPACTAAYGQIAVEIMRAINFYAFNYPDTRLEKVYICGGGAKIEPLLQQIKSSISMELVDIAKLMPQPEAGAEDLFLYSIAVGLTV